MGLLNECCFFFISHSLSISVFFFFFPDCFLLFPQANYNYNASSSASHPYYNQETESYTHMYPTSATGVVQGQGSQADQTQYDLEKVHCKGSLVHFVLNVLISDGTVEQK